MTAKNRQKSSAGEKSAAPAPDDAAKKAPKSNGVSGPAPQGPRAASGGGGGRLGLVASAVFYAALLGAVGVAAFYLQRAAEEIRHIGARQEESARRGAELGARVESVAQQVESLRSVVDGLESSLGVTRVELEGSVSRVKRGEAETRRVEDSLQKLQNDLLRDLSEGIDEVKESRERDFRSLEGTVGERLAEVSQSIKASVAEFAESQGEAQSQLAELRSRMGDMEDPTLIKRELAAIVEVVAEIRAAKEATDASAASLREQIGAVRAELQTRNQEVSSLSQEVETVRSVVQETVGNLRNSLSAAEAAIQALGDTSAALESSVGRATEAARHAERRVDEAAAEARKQSDDLEARVRASEESGDSLAASVSDITGKVEALLSKCDAHESSLAARDQAVETVSAGLGREIEALKSGLGELRASVANDGQAKATLGDLARQTRDLEERLGALESSGGGGGEEPEPLRSLKSAVAGLEAKAAKLEGHDQAISSLQRALLKTTQTLADMAKAKDVKRK